MTDGHKNGVLWFFTADHYTGCHSRAPVIVSLCSCEGRRLQRFKCGFFLIRIQVKQHDILLTPYGSLLQRPPLIELCPNPRKGEGGGGGAGGEGAGLLCLRTLSARWTPANIKGLYVMESSDKAASSQVKFLNQ